MNTQQIIDVVTAYRDGKTIQYRIHSDDPEMEWVTFRGKSKPLWNFEFTSYRVKPEPREWFICKNEVCHQCLKPCEHGCKVREVIE